MSTGRPTKYSEKMADLICQYVSTTPYGLNKICSLYDDIPEKTTVNVWRYKYPEFKEKYALAKLAQADLLAEECLEIADDDSGDTRVDLGTGFDVCNTEFIARSRLRIDTRKWLAAKLLPKQYGKPAEEDSSNNSEKFIEKLIDKLVDK